MPGYSKNEAFKAAQRALTEARSPFVRSQSPVGRVQGLVKRHALSLKRLGTSAKELAKLRRRAYLNLGQYHLQLARQPGNPVTNHALWPRTCVRRAGATLKAIGTTTEELLKLNERALWNAEWNAVSQPVLSGTSTYRSPDASLITNTNWLKNALRLAAPHGRLDPERTRRRKMLNAAIGPYIIQALSELFVDVSFIQLLEQHPKLIPSSSRAQIIALTSEVKQSIFVRETKQNYTRSFTEQSDTDPDVRDQAFRELLRVRELTLEDVGLTEECYRKTLYGACIRWANQMIRHLVWQLHNHQARETLYIPIYFSVWDQPTVEAHFANVRLVQTKLQAHQAPASETNLPEVFFDALLAEIESEKDRGQEPKDRFQYELFGKLI